MLKLPSTLVVFCPTIQIQPLNQRAFSEVFDLFLLQVLEGTVSTRIEGTQSVTREADKMWLVRLLEITRKYVLDDLIVVKNLMVQCFPPHYNTFNRYLSVCFFCQHKTSPKHKIMEHVILRIENLFFLST